MLGIAISGRAGSGKSTIANLIAKEIFQLQDSQVVFCAFAEKIKQITELMFPGCDHEALYGASELRQNNIQCDLNEDIDFNVTYRQANIDIGKLGRLYNPKFWVAHTALAYRQAQKIPNIELFIAGDCRFKEEVDWLKSKNFILVRVKRSDLIEIDDISETGQDGIPDSQFDHIIYNNKSINHLLNDLKSINFKE